MSEEAWFKLYQSLFTARVMSQEEINDMRDAINATLTHKLREGEISRALKAIAVKDVQQERTRKFPPTGVDIAKTICQNRKLARQNVTGEVGQHYYGVTVPDAHGAPSIRFVVETPAEWQRQLRAANDLADRFTVICRPWPIPQSIEREEFCVRNGLDFDRYVCELTRFDFRTPAVGSEL